VLIKGFGKRLEKPRTQGVQQRWVRIRRCGGKGTGKRDCVRGGREKGKKKKQLLERGGTKSGPEGLRSKRNQKKH